MRLIRGLISLIVLGLVIYVVVAVPLGQKTIWQHLRAIAGSKESQELVDEVKEKAKRIIHRDAGPAGKRTGSGDELTPDERRELRKLIKKKLKSD